MAHVTQIDSQSSMSNQPSIVGLERLLEICRETRYQIEKGSVAGRARAIDELLALIPDIADCIGGENEREHCTRLVTIYVIMDHISQAGLSMRVEPIEEAEYLIETLLERLDKAYRKAA
jgi:flagellin-specific chaperone FliS